MDSPKTNGSSAVQVSANGLSSAESEAKSAQIDMIEKSWSSDHADIEKSKTRKCIGENVLTLATLLGVVVGIALGIGLRYARTWSKREIMYVNFPGELFLNILKCLILPLIVSSLIAAVGSLDTKISGKIGLRAVAYYITTTILAIILGIVLVMTIRPGEGKSGEIPEEFREKETKVSFIEDTLMDLVRSMFPKNIIAATMKQSMTVVQRPKKWNKTENETTIDDMRNWDIKQESRDEMNILGTVVFSIVLGITLAKMKRRGKPLLDVFISLSDAMMLITRGVVWITPVGIVFLIASKLLDMKDLTEAVAQIGMYTVAVLVGILFHGFVVLPLIYFAFVRKNPYKFIIKMGQALTTAFATASSSATLPVTIACLEEKNGVDPRVARFCLPIGATMNMDGTALYEAVAAIFIAQVRQRPLNVGNIIAISITATAASVGAAGIPQAGLVTMVMVLNVVGLPAEDVALILVVDWLLDRFRTLVNVLGDAIGSAIVAHLSKNDLAELSGDTVSNLEMTTL